MEYRREDESNIPDRYLGTHLLDLYNELREARPRGISQWVQARAKERHFMIVTIAGALSAVLALALAMVQAWVYCQQWKHQDFTQGSTSAKSLSVVPWAQRGRHSKPLL